METKIEMSLFRAPITNKLPLRTVSLTEVAQMVKNPWLEPQTVALRLIQDEAEARRYKGWNFPYITPAGVFSYCADASMVKPSGVLCMDLDHLDDVDGLKWFLRVDLARCSHRQWFDAVRNYLMSMYGLGPKQADPSVRNESRACFLCYDPEVYVATSLLSNDK